MFLFKVFEEIAEKWAIMSLMRKQFSSQRHEWIVRFVRENLQMANRKLYREDVLQMLFADSDSEGEYFPFGNDDRTVLMIALLPVHLCSAMVPPCKAKSSRSTNKWSFDPLPNGDGCGRGGRGRSVHRRAVDLWAHGAPLAPRRGADDRPDCIFFFWSRALYGRQYRCSQCGVGLPYSQEL